MGNLNTKRQSINFQGEGLCFSNEPKKPSGCFINIKNWYFKKKYQHFSLKTTGSDYLCVASSRTIIFFYKILSHFFSPTKKHIHLPYKLNHKWYFPNFLKTFPILVNAFVMAHKCTNRAIHCIYTTTRRQAVCQDNLINYRLADPKISFLK